MDEHDHRGGNFFGKGKIRKSCRKPEANQDQVLQNGNANGNGKSVFGRWLKDFRSGQNREQKTQRPLGRTLSANVKDKDRKKKISRTLSANQKDRKKDGHWDSGIFHTRNYKSLTGGEDLNGYLDDQWTNGGEYRERSFSNPSPERFRRKRSSPEINRSALVSYLDEEGLKKVEEPEGEDTSIRSQDKTRNVPNQDGPIMPASSVQKNSTGINHYENHESLLLNDKQQDTDYLRIGYSCFKPETGKKGINYYNDHRYENLETTDYISWSSENDDKFHYEGCDVGEKDSSSPEKDLDRGFRFGYGDWEWCGSQDEPEAPARDPSSLKSIKYGPGHEKYPSWPGSVRPETGEKPQRSHSWTDQTNYPKEKVTSYARPLNKRTNPAFTQQLKTVMERCEKITPETFQKTMEQVEEREKRLYLPRVDREGKSIGDQDYMVPSPPERDKPTLTQADLDKYYQDAHLTKIDNGDYATPYEDMRKPPPLTQADLEEYARSYDESLKPHHQHQGSYAQSEGYHSYVSSSELTTTPFLDRLRRDSDTGMRTQHWSEEDGRAGRDSVVTTSSGSASSSETLKWHGSMSDVSLSSSSCRSRQLIAHSSRVPPPQRHHSESVLYLGSQGGNSWSGKGDRSQQLKLFPVNTYTVQPHEQNKTVISPTSVPKMSVAERISELERQQQAQKFAYFDPEKRHKVSDPTLKAIQKKALLSFYERHQHATGLAKVQDSWKGEQVPEVMQKNSAPPPPPRPVSSRRASCASDMSVSSWGKSNHSYSCSLVGPVIVGPSISIDDWVPELPPKKPHLRTIPPPLPHRSPSPLQVPPTGADVEPPHYQKTFERMPTPDLPLPPPPPAPEEEVLASDEPLPPPPPEAEWHVAVPGRSTPSPQPPSRKNSEVEPPSDSIRSLLIPDAYEIQYDQDAINAIMESNRLAEFQKKKYSKSKHGVGKEEEKSPLKMHIENRPPLPLPRDVVCERKPEGCDRGSWHKSKENIESRVPFVRSFSKPENSMRASIKAAKTDPPRNSLRYPSKKPATNGRVKERLSPEVQKPLPKTKVEQGKPFMVKKVSEYECRIPNRERDGLTVFETTAIDDAKQTTEPPSKGSNSKAAFLALRREKELGMGNCEGSYKLTVSSSGEMIDATSPEKAPLEMLKMKERSTENLVLDNRLTLEPPDLIPKIGNLNRKSSSVQDVRDNRKKYEYGRYGNDKYRLIPTANRPPGGIYPPGGETECRVTFDCSPPNDGRDGERVPVTTVECVRAVITKLESEPPPERLDQRNQSNGYVPEEDGDDKYGVSFTLSRTEPDKEKPPSLLRVRSNVEKRVNRSDSMKSNEGKVERSKSLKLVERSTSFGRTDSMTVVEAPDRRNLNLSVSDASSQTDLLEEEQPAVRDEAAQRKLEEELECERLSRDLASQLSPSDKLQSLLVPDSERKKPTDYVAGLFCLEVSSKGRRHLSTKKDKPSEPEVILNGLTPNQHDSTEERSSDGKAPDADVRHLQKKKEELMARLGRKLAVLKEEQDALTNESTANEELGTAVANSVAKSARPHELAKYRLHVEEVGKITSLLLGLSGRLAKVENALLGLPSHHDDRKIHEGKRDKLQEQLAEAKQLKENIDRRSDSVAKTLGKYLTAEEYADYVHFIRMKAKLIVDLREIAEKISFGEEQLAALKETS